MKSHLIIQMAFFMLISFGQVDLHSGLPNLFFIAETQINFKLSF